MHVLKLRELNFPQNVVAAIQTVATFLTITTTMTTTTTTILRVRNVVEL